MNARFLRDRHLGCSGSAALRTRLSLLGEMFADSLAHELSYADFEKPRAGFDAPLKLGLNPHANGVHEAPLCRRWRGSGLFHRGGRILRCGFTVTR